MLTEGGKKPFNKILVTFMQKHVTHIKQTPELCYFTRGVGMGAKQTGLVAGRGRGRCAFE